MVLNYVHCCGKVFTREDDCFDNCWNLLGYFAVVADSRCPFGGRSETVGDWFGRLCRVTVIGWWTVFRLFSLITVVGIGVSSAYIHGIGTAVYSSDRACGAFPENVVSGESDLVATAQNWKLWHATYNFHHVTGSIQRMCPSLGADTNVFLGGALVSRSHVSGDTTLVKDCHGDDLFAISRELEQSTYTIRQGGRNGALAGSFHDGYTLDVISGMKHWDSEIYVKVREPSALWHMSASRLAHHIKNRTCTAVLWHTWFGHSCTRSTAGQFTC